MQLIFVLIGICVGSVLGSAIDSLLAILFAIFGAALGGLIGQGLSLSQLRRLVGAQQLRILQLIAAVERLTARLDTIENAGLLEKPEAEKQASGEKVGIDVPQSLFLSLDKTGPKKQATSDNEAVVHDSLLYECENASAMRRFTADIKDGELPDFSDEELCFVGDDGRRAENSRFSLHEVRTNEQQGRLGKYAQGVKSWLIGGNPILRIGAFVLFLGLAFLLRFTSQHVYVPVEFRYTAVAAAGLALTIIGWLLRFRNSNYALILQGTGIAVFYLTVFAALKLNPILSPIAAFAILIAVTAAAIILALLQNSLSLAIAAFMGGFAAPILVSSGGGSHIGLFSYLALLNIALVIIAWFRAWRPLNLVGFVATFGIGSAWGIGAYGPQYFTTTEPFLIFFYMLYMAIAFLYARRRLLEAGSPPDNIADDKRLLWAAKQTHYVDGTLFFGLSIIGFGLQYALVRDFVFGPAFSALGLGLFYISIAFVLLYQWRGQLQLLFEIAIALGVIFTSLAVPLGLTAEWTSAVWAVEGAGIYWLTNRQPRLLGRMFAVLIQAYAFLTWGSEIEWGNVTLLSGSAFGALLIALSFAFSWYQTINSHAQDQGPFERYFRKGFAAGAVIALFAVPALCLEREFNVIAAALLVPLVVLFGIKKQETVVFFIAIFAHITALCSCIAVFSIPDQKLFLLLAMTVLFCTIFATALLFHKYRRSNDQSTHKLYGILSHICLFYAIVIWVCVAVPPIPGVTLFFSQVYQALVLSALAALAFVIIAKRYDWLMLSKVLVAFIPFVLAILIWGVLCQDRTFYDLLDSEEILLSGSTDWQPLAHGGWIAWTLCFVAQFYILKELRSRVAPLLRSLNEACGVWLLVLVCILICYHGLINFVGISNAWRLSGVMLPPALYLFFVTNMRGRLPVATSPFIYCFIAAIPMAAFLLIWILGADIFDPGFADPLPFFPILNPLEIGVFISFIAILGWRKSVAKALDRHFGKIFINGILGAMIFVIFTLVVLRGVHHYGAVPWDVVSLAASMTAQTSLSIFWTIAALGIMLYGHKHAMRAAWLCGGVLIGGVFVKLLLVDLGSGATMERIVSFIGVGILLLVVGYFVPLPPRTQRPVSDVTEETADFFADAKVPGRKDT